MVHLSTELQGGASVPPCVSTGGFTALSGVPAAFQTQVSLQNTGPITHTIPKAASGKSAPRGVSVRDILMHAFCNDLFSKMDQISDQFPGHDKCFPEFGCVVTQPSKGFSSCISSITFPLPELCVLFFRDA